MGVGSAWSRGMSGGETQEARKPPSTGTVEPVVMLLRSLSRKRMMSTTFSTSAGRVLGEGGCPSPFPPTPHRGRYRDSWCNSPLGSCLTHQQTCQVGFDPAWSWPFGGCSNWPGPWVSSPLWGSPRSRGSTPEQAGGQQGRLGAQGRWAG